MSDAVSVGEVNVSNMSPTYKAALISLLFQLADDDLVFGHRSSEWLGLAPDLEEDIAFSSIAQDEVGHAALYYELLESLTGTNPDELAFGRTAAQRLNARLLEQPNSDWAYTIFRGFVYNAFEHVRLQSLLESSYTPLQQAARKILREERYHLLHMQTWVENLGRAQGEARERLERAATRVWSDISDMFQTGEHADILVREHILPSGELELTQRWRESIEPVVESAGLSLPAAWPETASGRQQLHSHYLTQLLATMTEVYDSDTTAKW